MRLADRVALVTGGARNIGQAISLALAREGAQVVVSDVIQEEGQKTVSEILAQEGEACFIGADVRIQEDISYLVEETWKRMGGIHILVNNAGVQLKKQGLLQLQEEEWDKTFDVNLKGLCFLSQGVARIMKRQGGGKIINLASIAGGSVFSADNLAYTISKGAVRAATSQMAVELAPYNIQVNAIAPGYVDTSMNQETFSRPGAREEIAKKIPLGRIAKPQEMTGLVIFLSGDESSYLTGETIVMDGGYSLL